MNIRLTKARAFELDPNKAYLILVKSSVVSKVQAELLVEELHKMGVPNAIVAINEKNAYKIVELPVAAKKAAKTATRQARVKAKKGE